MFVFYGFIFPAPGIAKAGKSLSWRLQAGQTRQNYEIRLSCEWMTDSQAF
jgi:hypothetical protein